MMAATPQFDFSDIPFYQHESGMRYSRGVQTLVETHGLYWLLDTIALYQPVVCSNSRLTKFQLWELRVHAREGLLTCREDSGMKPVWQRHIEFTDCPLHSVKVYVEDNVLLLPSEH